MKLIMERWDNYILSEQDPQQDEITTVGQLKAVIRTFRQAKGAGGAGKLALQAVPVVSNVYNVFAAAKDAKEALAGLMGMDDKFTTQAGLDKLNVDDNIQKIVDDKIEAAFMNHALETIDGMGEFEEIPDINQMLQDFLEDKFDHHSVKR
tara:strand:+ start:30 stop:479 length:450 start_codon:yes stop_codon:yes gene_type:complete